MKKFYTLITLLTLLFSATSMKAQGYYNEEIVEGTQYYLYNASVNKFLNDNNGLDETPTTLWTFDLTTKSIVSNNGKYVNVTRTGTIIYKYTWTSNATSNTKDGVDKIEQNGDGYQISHHYSLADCCLAANASGLTYALGFQDNSKWTVVSPKQYQEIKELLANLKIEGSEIAEGNFYLYNIRSGMFLKAGAESLTTGTPTLWTLTKNANNETYTITNGSNNVNADFILESLGNYSGKVSTTDSKAMSFTVSGSDKIYSFSYVHNPTYVAPHTFYLSVEEKTEYDGSEIATMLEKNSIFGKWLLVTEDTYKAFMNDRNNAIARLQSAIAAGKVAEGLPAPAAVKGDILSLLDGSTLSRTLSNAETIYKERDSKKWFGLSNEYKHSVSDINEAADNLEKSVALVNELTDYYAAAMEAKDLIAGIPGVGNAVGSWLAGATGIDRAKTIEQMESSMKTLRTEAVLTMGLANLKAGNDLSGLITNHSFDTGTMTGWYTANQNNTFAETSRPVENKAENYIEGGHNKYYYQTKNTLGLGEQLYQPIVNLPKGAYEFSASMVPLGLISNDVHVQVFVIPLSAVDIELGSNINETIMKSMMSSLGNLLKNAKIYNGKASTSSDNKFEVASTQFEIDSNSFFIVSLNSGLTATAGMYAFAADDVRLKYLGETVPTGINATETVTDNNTYYNVNGVQTAAPAKGINIQRTADGKVKKFIVK